jgi:hypothetical protein
LLRRRILGELSNTALKEVEFLTMLEEELVHPLGRDQVDLNWGC